MAGRATPSKKAAASRDDSIDRLWLKSSEDLIAEERYLCMKAGMGAKRGNSLPRAGGAGEPCPIAIEGKKDRGRGGWRAACPAVGPGE
jgi:hypothetical protein